MRRSVTTTPLQALTLLNDPAYAEIALALAKRIVREAASVSLEKQLEYGFRLCLTRLPEPREVAYLVELFQTQRQRFITEPGRARDLLGSRDLSPAAAAELAGWFYVANVLLNLDELITKG